MTSKEALDLLYSDAINGNMDENHEYINREEIEREYFEIKHDLERLEKLEEAHKNLWDIAYNRYYKVIKILKKYFGLMEYEEFEEYKIFTHDGYFVLEITKEEYELLKEVFGND